MATQAQDPSQFAFPQVRPPVESQSRSALLTPPTTPATTEHHPEMSAARAPFPIAAHSQPTAAFHPPCSTGPTPTTETANQAHFPPPVWPSLTNRPVSGSRPNQHMLETSSAQEKAPLALTSSCSPDAFTQSAYPQPQAQSSYAQLVDPNEGNELKFVPTHTINGVRCTQIERTDVEDEICYWQSAVLCSVMGANPPFEIMKGYLKRIWANLEIDRILYVRKGVFLVRFAHLRDKISVEKRGIYFFDSKPMLVKGWNPNMDLQTESIRSLPIWIQLPALDIKYWGIESLSKIGSILGIPIKTDKYTKEKQAIRYARLLVEMTIEGPFPEQIDFFNEEGILIRQSVTYEWIPSKCTHCDMLGHTEAVCKKKGEVRKEWRRIVKPTATYPQGNCIQSCTLPLTNPTPQQEEDTSPRSHHAPIADSTQGNLIISTRPREATAQHKLPDAFTPVSKRASSKRSLSAPAESSAIQQNNFSALNEVHILDVLPDGMHRENSPSLPPHEPDC